MSIIIISSDSYSIGREIAMRTAEAVDYAFQGREILEKVADTYQIEEAKLVKALDETPSLLGMSTRLRNRYLAYIVEATLGALLKDKVVCQGLAAHLYVLGVSHVLRVRILADAERSPQQSVPEEGVSIKEAHKRLERRNKLRRRWSMDAFDLDETDPSQYDLVISLSQIDRDEAVKIITETVAYRRFNPMTYSIKCLNDLELASRVRAVLLARFPDVRVRARSGTLVVETTALKREKRKRAQAIKEIAGKIPGVEYIEVHVINDIFRRAAESFR
ncbi:MAG: cytidylate kinase family protein [Deltaproteobacteria bacterium]|nr:cytidylate kinase family protein [Deltaproteobacteria bacterium]